MPATLEIVMDDSGRMTVNGPIDNLALCYGLMEIAKDVLRERQAKKAASPIIPAASMPQLVR